MKRTLCFLLLGIMLFSAFCVKAQTDTVRDTPSDSVAEQAPSPASAESSEPLFFRFTTSDEFPMPGKYALHKKMHYTFDGTVTSKEPLTAVYVRVLTPKGKKVKEVSAKYTEEKQIREVRLLDPTFPKNSRCLSEKLKTETLDVGKYVFTITAEDAVGHSEQLFSSEFKVVNPYSIQLIPNNLRNNYTTALAFFGSEERFLFPFTYSRGQFIDIDTHWLKKYTAKCKGLDGHKWEVHKDAVPYFNKACDYLSNTFIRVHGTNGDSGVIRLKSFAKMSGTMITRFTQFKQFVSHHSFGTAVDINAHEQYNSGKLKYRKQIYRDVTNNLVYNGIKEKDGRSYYDFTYSGNAKNMKNKRIPSSIANYLLYELAFYRAGFGWGLYYPHKCDAMHFSLTEIDPALFETGEYAMRKVFIYID